MANKRHKPEEIVSKPRQVDVLLVQVINFLCALDGRAIFPVEHLVQEPRDITALRNAGHVIRVNDIFRGIGLEPDIGFRRDLLKIAEAEACSDDGAMIAGLHLPELPPSRGRRFVP